MYSCIAKIKLIFYFFRPTKQLETLFVIVYKLRSVLVSFRRRTSEGDSDETLVDQSSGERQDIQLSELREDDYTAIGTPDHSRDLILLDESMEVDHDSQEIFGGMIYFF